MPKDRKRWRRVGPLGTLSLAGLLLAACGGGATPTATTGAASRAAPVVPSAAPTTAAASASTVVSITDAAATIVSTTTSPASSTALATGGATPSNVVATAPHAAATVTSATRYVIVPTNSKATYKVNETFFNQGNRLNVAEGTTGDITGEIAIDKAKPSASRVGMIKVDISKLASDSEQRDDQLRDHWLESTKFPTATFVAKRLEGLPETPYPEGAELTFKIIGDLTIRNVTKEVTFDAKGKVVGDLLTGTATTTFNMTDFGFDPPSILGILKAENGVELTLTIEAKRIP